MDERHQKATCDNCGKVIERSPAGTWPDARRVSLSLSLAAPPDYGDPKGGYTSASQTYTKGEALLCRTCEEKVRADFAALVIRWEEARRV